MAHKVKCRFCQEQFDIEKGQEGVDWVQQPLKWYYHKQCYELKLQKAKGINIYTKEDNDFWFDELWSYLRYDLKIDLNYYLMRNQWEGFLKKKMTAKGIYFAIYYGYEVKHLNAEKSNGGIGITPYIYQEAKDYYISKAENNEHILDTILQQINERRERKTIKLRGTDNKKHVSKFDLNDVGDEDEW